MATGNTLFGALAAQAAVGPTSGYATPDTRAGATNSQMPVLDFDDTTDESADFAFVCPSALTANAGVTVRLGWAATTATSGDVVWNVGLNAFTDDTDDMDSVALGTPNAATVATASASGEIAYDTIAFTSAAHGFIAAGEVVRMRVTRDADNGSDTLVGDAELVSVEVYET